ncbi:MAG: 16S rRNA (cytosine(1402)-N(4))-methyltransferase RsmH [Clostridium sp.]
MEFKHISVLLDECIEALNIKEDGIYIDGTLGGAGHSLEILKRLNNGTLIGIDRDEEALLVAQQKLKEAEKNNNVILVHNIHEHIPTILDALEISKVDGVLLDLGMSSYQIDNIDRGFSYMHNAELDMRMNQKSDITAKHIVNNYSKEKLIRIFKEYGEEKFAVPIANKIVSVRTNKEINTTFELNEIIDSVKPFSKKGHKSKQVFQALRIEVNNELVLLKDAIIQIGKRLKSKGRFAIITFHSLEDKIVKEAFKELVGKCTCPPDLPICICNNVSYGKLVNSKPILPTEEEINRNSRSKSAKLRIFQAK